MTLVKNTITTFQLPSKLLAAFAFLALSSVPMGAQTVIFSEDWETGFTNGDQLTNGSADVGTYTVSNNPFTRNATGGNLPGSLYDGMYAALDSGNDMIAFDPTDLTQELSAISLEFALHLTNNAGTTAGEGVLFNLFHGTSTSGARVVFGTDGNIYQRSSTANPVASTVLGLNKWIDVTMTFQLGNTFSIKLDDGTISETLSVAAYEGNGGQLLATDIFRQAQFREQSSSTAGNEYAFIDNIVITTVPEPSTYAIFAGLLALGSVLVRRRR